MPGKSHFRHDFATDPILLMAFLRRPEDRWGRREVSSGASQQSFLKFSEKSCHLQRWTAAGTGSNLGGEMRRSLLLQKTTPF